MAKLSIVCISYNRPEFLQEAMDSVFAQTMTDWELLITDQASPRMAETRAICQQAVKDPRVHVIYNDVNIDNLAVVRNTMLDQATGEYWCAFDDDNRLCPDFAEKMCGWLDTHPDNAVAVCGMKHFGNNTGTHIPIPGQLLNLPGVNFIDSGEVAYRRRVIDEIGYYDERMVSQEDWDMILRVYRHYGEAGFGFVGEPLTEYRWSPGKRLERSMELKYAECKKIIQDRHAKRALKVWVQCPDSPEVTLSQHQVHAGIAEALWNVPFIEMVDGEPDLILCPGPIWHFDRNRLRELRQKAPTMALLLEDPQGIMGNLRVLNEFDWIVSNDVAAAEFYQSVFRVPKQVYQWNALSLTDEVLDYCREHDPPKVYDVCFIGTPYPSRVEFMQDLCRHLPGLSLVLIGDGWDKVHNVGAMCYPNLNPLETAKVGLQSRIILCKHRTEKDIGGFPVMPPASVNRGYVELAYRAHVMVDNDRHENSFPAGTVGVYLDVAEAAAEIKFLLDGRGPEPPMPEIASCFTYTARLTRLLNCWRSPRYGAKIP